MPGHQPILVEGFGRLSQCSSLFLPVTAGVRTMWKSFLLASGIFACVLGLEMLLIDSAVIASMNGQEAVFRAPDWMPWTLLSVGAATILHFCHLPATAGQSAS